MCEDYFDMLHGKGSTIGSFSMKVKLILSFEGIKSIIVVRINVIVPYEETG